MVWRQRFYPGLQDRECSCVQRYLLGIERVFAWQILVPYNREKEVFYSTAAGAVVNFVLNLFFISRWGAVGAAATTVISEFVVFLMCTFQCRNVISCRVVYRYLWQYLLVATLAVPIAGKVVQSLAVSAFAGMVVQICDLRTFVRGRFAVA